MTSGRDIDLPTSAGARFFYYYLGSFSSRYAY